MSTVMGHSLLLVWHFICEPEGYVKWIHFCAIELYTAASQALCWRLLWQQADHPMRQVTDSMTQDSTTQNITSVDIAAQNSAAGSSGFLTEEQIRKFHHDGYVFVDFGFPHELLDELVTTMRPYYNPEDLQAPSFGARIQDAWKFVKPAHALATNANVLIALGQLFQRRALPFQTLNFPVGTQQKTHSDTIHFNSVPGGFMAGVWVALEDIDEDNGPLQYYPGTHRLPEITMQDIGLEPGYHNYVHYEAHIARHAKELGLEPAFGHMPKGHALIWHANLLHGGSRQNNPRRTRHSQVTHYFFEDCQYYTPLLSAPEVPVWRKLEWIDADNWVMRPPVRQNESARTMATTAMNKVSGKVEHLREWLLGRRG